MAMLAETNHRSTRGFLMRGASLARAVSAGAVIGVFGLMLSGCGMTQIASGIGGGLFGSSDKEKKEFTPEVSEERLLAAAKSDAGASDLVTPAQGCPKFSAWPADRYVTVYEPGRDGDGLAIMYRGEITKTARECEVVNGEMVVKYGMAGRVLMGPRGKSGNVNLPVRVYVTNDQRAELTAEKIQVAVDVAPERPIGYFSIVRRITFPLQPGAPVRDYNVLVGFERASPGAG